MRGFLVFEWEMESTDGHTDLALCLFHGYGEVESSHLATAVEGALESRLSPDLLIVMCSVAQAAALRSALETPEVLKAFDRNPRIRIKTVLLFDRTGKFVDQVSTMEIDASTITRVNTKIQGLRQSGISEICSRNEALIRAPTGFLFAKPSKRGASHFIRAENLLATSEEISFLAFCVLPHLDAWLLAPDTEFKTLYIDSMSIASLAFCLLDMGKALGLFPTPPRIVSFHSYDGLEELEIPFARSAFTIISASSSGGLASAFRKKKEREDDEVLSILVLENEDLGNKILFEIGKPSDWIEADPTNNYGGYKTINIVGEHFLAEPQPARKVFLTKFYLPSAQKSLLSSLVGADLFTAKKRDVVTSHVRGLHVDGPKLISLAPFGDWVKTEVTKLLPNAPHLIIYQEDEASEKMARMAVSILSESDVQTQLVTASMVYALREVDDVPVLVVSAVLGDGGRLLEISRDLRSVHKNGKRVYLVGISASQSHEKRDKIRKNICQPANRYSLEVFCNLPMAVEPALRFWESEARLLSSYPTESGEFEKRLQRLDAVAGGLLNDAYLPSCKSEECLALAPSGFVFLDEGYPLVSQSDVLSVVACVLQYAREVEQLNPTTNEKMPLLRSFAFEQVVLDPECFVRFDDSVIQAAFLRLCTESELDYSGNISLSKEMLSIILRIVRAHMRPRGAATMDFLMALAVKRLKISRQDLDTLFVELKRIQLASTSSKLQALIDIVIKT